MLYEEQKPIHSGPLKRQESINTVHRTRGRRVLLWSTGPGVREYNYGPQDQGQESITTVHRTRGRRVLLLSTGPGVGEYNYGPQD